MRMRARRHAQAGCEIGRLSAFQVNAAPAQPLGSSPLARGAAVSSPLSAFAITLLGPRLGPVQLFAR
jgi:hypothetical protein